MFCADCNKRGTIFRKTNVKDTICVTFLLTTCSSCHIKDINIMVVIKVNKGHHRIVWTNGYSIDPSRALWELKSLNLLSCL
jgi:hypothetical protein